MQKFDDELFKVDDNRAYLMMDLPQTLLYIYIPILTKKYIVKIETNTLMVIFG